MTLLKIEIDRLVLQTRATPAILAVLPRLEGHRRWLKGGGLSVEATPLNQKILTSIPGVVLETPPNLVDGAALALSWAEPTYVQKTKPYAHQTRALAKINGHNVIGLFMEQGTGKTKVLLDWAGELHCRGLITGVLVVSKKGVHRQWAESEIPKHLNIPFNAAFWPIKLLPKEDKALLEFFTINWDGMKTPAGMLVSAAFCTRHRDKLLIVADESQEMKNKKSGRWEAIDDLKPFSSHRALATGTPIAKDLTDEWAQLSWLDERIIGIRYVTAFRSEFCIMGGFQGRVIIGHKNIEAFKKLTDPYVFRATKDEIGILPKQYSEWVFDLNKHQKGMLISLKQNLEAALSSGQVITVQHAAVTLNKMQQVASGFIIDEDKKVHRLMPVDANPRADAALDWLAAIEGKAVIWVRFREDTSILHEALNGEGVEFVEYHGSVTDKARAEAVKSFLAPNGARVFLANPQSAGTGLNLQGACRNALYYSNSFNSIDRWQSEDRIHRIGTVGAVTYTDMIAKNSIDRHIIRNLLRKKGLSELVLDDVKQILKDLNND